MLKPLFFSFQLLVVFLFARLIASLFWNWKFKITAYTYYLVLGTALASSVTPLFSETYGNNMDDKVSVEQFDYAVC